MIETQVQRAIRDALQIAPPVAGDNIFDFVPEGAPFPRVTIGEEQIVGDGNSCGDGWEVFADVHVWSREAGFAEAKVLAAAVSERICAISAITGFNLISVEMRDQRRMRDPDGLTSHIVLSFQFTLDET